MNENTVGNTDEPIFEEIEHTADWALKVRGANLEELLQNAAFGMLQLIRATPHAFEGQERMIEIKAPDQETLLVSWLEELLFIIEFHEMTFTEVSVQIHDQYQLRARIWEIPLAEVEKQIKAVTYHDLKIEPFDGGVEATVVFDV